MAHTNNVLNPLQKKAQDHTRWRLCPSHNSFHMHGWKSRKRCSLCLKPMLSGSTPKREDWHLRTLTPCQCGTSGVRWQHWIIKLRVRYIIYWGIWLGVTITQTLQYSETCHYDRDSLYALCGYSLIRDKRVLFFTRSCNAAAVWSVCLQSRMWIHSEAFLHETQGLWPICIKTTGIDFTSDLWHRGMRFQPLHCQWMSMSTS